MTCYYCSTPQNYYFKIALFPWNRSGTIRSVITGEASPRNPDHGSRCRVGLYRNVVLVPRPQVSFTPSQSYHPRLFELLCKVIIHVSHSAKLFSQVICTPRLFVLLCKVIIHVSHSAKLLSHTTRSIGVIYDNVPAIGYGCVALIGIGNQLSTVAAITAIEEVQTVLCRRKLSPKNRYIHTNILQCSSNFKF